jgi:hypothetical protein
MSSTADPRECRAKGEDYFECLHHHKEYTRYNPLAAALARRKSAGDSPQSGDILHSVDGSEVTIASG